MRAVVLGVVVVGLLGSPVGGRAADDNKDAIIGLWELAFSDAKDIPAGTRLEFTKDGKVKLALRSDGKEITADDVYKVEKDVLTLGGADPRNQRTGDSGRICLLNKTTLVIHDELEDKVLVLKRLKPDTK
ncbi:MAG TPA: hypothetical protein VGE74_14820 [Gemmata sp.]